MDGVVDALAAGPFAQLRERRREVAGDADFVSSHAAQSLPEHVSSRS
jgi:hypothetical protein